MLVENDGEDFVIKEKVMEQFWHEVLVVWYYNCWKITIITK